MSPRVDSSYEPTWGGPRLFYCRSGASDMELCLLDFTMKPPGEFQRLSAKHPLVQWEVRPLSRQWLVSCKRAIRGPSTPQTPSSADSSFGESTEGTSTYLYVPSGVEQRFVESLCRGGTSIIPPLRWRGGRLMVRLVSFGDTTPLGWSAAFPGARLVRKRKTDPLKLLGQFDQWAEGTWGPTLRQSAILLEAIRLGYYELPRRTTVRDIARQFGIARSTAEEHLRAAESATIRSSALLLAARQQLRSRNESPSEAQVFEELARFAAELDLFLRLALRDKRIERLDAHLQRGHRARPNGDPGTPEPPSSWVSHFNLAGDRPLRGEGRGPVDSTRRNRASLRSHPVPSVLAGAVVPMEST